MDVEHLTLFLLTVFRDVFAYTAALLLGFSVAFQIIDAIVKALSPNESWKGGD